LFFLLFAVTLNAQTGKQNIEVRPGAPT